MCGRFSLQAQASHAESDSVLQTVLYRYNMYESRCVASGAIITGQMV